MGHEPYQKHQLYSGDYPTFPGGVTLPPEKCSWVVIRYAGHRNFGEDAKGEIALILNEDQASTNGFWSVISFLTKEEALALAGSLQMAAHVFPAE